MKMKLIQKLINPEELHQYNEGTRTFFRIHYTDIDKQKRQGDYQKKHNLQRIIDNKYNTDIKILYCEVIPDD